MDVTVVIVNYNTCDLTRECVSSVFKKTRDIEFEVVVVDNNSSDGSCEQLTKAFSQDKRFLLIPNSTNLGFAKACNQGIKIAKGKYIFLLNSDTELVDDTLTKLLAFAGERENVGIVGPRLLNSNKTVQPSVYRLPTLGRTLQQYWFGKKGILDKYAPEGDAPSKVECIVGGAFLITPQALKKVGSLDERYFMYFEDLDYCRRVQKAGLEVYYYPDTQVVHYHGASGKNMVPEELQWKRLIPSSRIYHGVVIHYLIGFIIWSSQKIQKVFG